jgi:TolA-binding protein
MKRSERHHLKENEISRTVNEAITRLTENKRTAGMTAIAIVVALLAGVGYWAWRTRAEVRAQTMFGEALIVMQAPVQAPAAAVEGAKPEQQPGTYPTLAARAEAALPKFMAVAGAYPSSESGIAARYYAASALALLGRAPEAATRYQEVIDRAGAGSFMEKMARLGLVDAQLLAKQYDQAITGARVLADANDEELPRDAILMHLGRIYAAAGKPTEAKQTFDKIVAEFPDSLYAEEARQQLEVMTQPAS